MAVFDGDYPQLQNTTVSVSGATQVFAVSGANVSHGGLTYNWNFTTSTPAEQAYTVLNVGPNIVYVSTDSAMVQPEGVLLNKGEQLTVQGLVQNLYAAVANGNSAQVITSLASNPSVV